MQLLAPTFSTNRMVREYAETLYVPASRRGVALAANSHKRAIELARCKDHLRQQWTNIKVVGVHTSGNGHFQVGETLQVEALVELPSLRPDDVALELYAGTISSTGEEIENPKVIKMAHVREVAAERHLFVGKIACETSGRQGFALRIIPGVRDMATPFEPGLIIWN
jgi:starch phosphorylase